MDPLFNEVCFSCNKRLGERLWEKYQSLLKEGVDFESSLNQMRIIRGCCRRMFFSYVPMKEYPDNPNVCRTSLLDDGSIDAIDETLASGNTVSDRDDSRRSKDTKGGRRVKFESGNLEELKVLETKISTIRKKTKRWLSEIGENYKKVPSREEMLSLETKSVSAYFEDQKKFVEITYPEALSLETQGKTIFYKRGLVYELEKALARLFPEESEVDAETSLLEEEPLEDDSASVSGSRGKTKKISTPSSSDSPSSQGTSLGGCQGCEGRGLSEERQSKRSPRQGKQSRRQEEKRLEKETPKEKFYVCKGCGLRYGTLGCDCVGILLLKTGSAERETGEYWCLTCGDDEKVQDLKMTCNSCGTKKKFPKVMEDLDSGDLNKAFLSSKNLNYVCKECIDFED
jgi:DNA-directed RNA polymerase subunit N (RpoN/RPB10)